VKQGTRHPLHAFLEAGVKVALCCDNSTVSRTDAVRESALAASQVGLEAVERIHREADALSFIRPETALGRGSDD
jgi:adenosine deaminase